MDFDSVDTVQGLASQEINRMTNPQLKRALNTLVSAQREISQRGDGPTNAVLLQEIKKLREEVKEIRDLKMQVQCLSEKLDDAFTTIHNQQLFIEAIDAKERKCNLVITGVLEGETDTDLTDREKVKEILEAARYSEPFSTEEWELRRLGQQNERKKRPILVKVKNQKQRDGIIDVAKNLKEAREPFSRVYIKKDLHPCIRKEFARLRKREREEKEKAANTATVITYDRKKRVLLRDEVVIDRFFPRFF